MKERKIVVFDFDGTLTHKDTLLEFIKFAKGKWQFYIGIIICSPILMAYLLRLMKNDKAKQFVFRYFFKGMSYRKFKQLGEQFSSRIDDIVNKHTLDILKQHSLNGATIYVISASITEWVEPWCKANHVTQVIGTLAEVSNNGRLTGRFLTPNCYGIEKVRRLQETEPYRDTYYLVAYGDSDGDIELLDYANEGHFIEKEKSILDISKIQELIRFGITGFIAVIIQITTYYLFVRHYNHNIALPISYIVSLTFNYIMTTLFTFRVKPCKKNGVYFLCSHAINYTLQLIFLNLFVWMGITKEWAIIPVIGVCFPINFSILRYLIKNKR